MAPKHSKEKGGKGSRQEVRRIMAYGYFWLTIVMTISCLFCLTTDELAGRLEKVWPAWSTIFTAFVAYLCWYAKLGSDETRHELTLGSTPMPGYTPMPSPMPMTQPYTPTPMPTMPPYSGTPAPGVYTTPGGYTPPHANAPPPVATFNP